jgi:hypothetical protein
VIEREQAGGGIGAPAAKTSADGYFLCKADVGAQSGTGCRLQRFGSANAQVCLSGQPRYLQRAANQAIGPHFDPDFIAEIDKLKTGLQLVVAIGTPTQNMQKQIELCRCGPHRPRGDHLDQYQ